MTVLLLLKPGEEHFLKLLGASFVTILEIIVLTKSCFLLSLYEYVHLSSKYL